MVNAVLLLSPRYSIYSSLFFIFVIVLFLMKISDGPMVPYAVKTYLPILESVRTGVLSDRAILCQVLDDRRFVEACVILLRNCVEVPNLRVPKEIETKLKKEKSKVKLLLDRKQSLANKRRALTVKLVKLIAQIRA